MGRLFKNIMVVFLTLALVFTMIPQTSVLAAKGSSKANAISKCSISLSKESFNYTGKACKPTIIVKNKGVTLKKGKDYTLKYENNKNPGKASVTIKGKGKYSGNVTRTFKIVNGLKVTIAKKEYNYTGTAIKPAVKVKCGKKKLKASQYSVTYKKNTEVGTASIIVKGKGAYKGKNALVTFEIKGEEGSDNKTEQQDSKQTEQQDSKQNENTGAQTGKLTLELTEGALLAGESYKIKVLASEGNLNYSTSNSKVAGIDVDGTIHTYESGDVDITVSDSKSSATFKLHVWDFDFSSLKEALGPGETRQISIIRGGNGAVYTWESDNTSVATVDQNGLITAVKGAAGKANIRLAVQTLNGISYSRNIEIEVIGLSSKYTVNKTGSQYATASGNVLKAFTDGQSAQINLVEGSLDAAGCNGDAYWHNTGLSSAYYNGYNYYFVTDTWNNRVMVYKVPENVTWGYDRHSALDYLYCILGQKSTSAKKAGYGLDQLNWPTEAAVAVVNNELRVFVTDTNNNRILVWNNLFAVDIAGSANYGKNMGPSADYSIMEKCDVRNVAFNSGNLAGASMSNESEAGIKWPWAIWTDGNRLICTSTQDGYLMIWDTLPTGAKDKYPDRVIHMGGTIRTIACKDNYLLLGDHNIKTPEGDKQGLKIVKDYSKLTYKEVKNKNNPGQTLFEYAEIGLGSGDSAYSYYEVDGAQPSGFFLTSDLRLDNGGMLPKGTLLLNCVGSVEVRLDGNITGNDDRPDYYIGGGVVGDTRLFRFTSADDAPVMVDHSGNMYVAMGNTGIVAGYKAGTVPSAPADIDAATVAAQDGDTFIYNGQYYENNKRTGVLEKHSAVFPNAWLGAKSVTEDAYKSSHRYQNCMVSTDGQHLVAASDHGTGSLLMLWKSIPDQSNALPDTVYTFTVEDDMKDTAVYNNGSTTMLMAGGRESVFIWKDINTAINGGEPDLYYRKKIGSVQVDEIESFAFDGSYFYLSDKNGLYIFYGLPEADQQPVSTINYPGGKIEVTNCDDGETYIGIANSDSDENKGGPRIYTRTEALKNGSYYFLNGAVRELVQGLEGESISGKKKPAEKLDRAGFNGPSNVLVTKEGKVIVADTAFYRVLIWDSITEALNEGKTNVKSSSRITLGYGADYYDLWDVLKADPSNYYHTMTPDEISMESPTTLFRPCSLAYDGNYLWIGDFKFSGGIKRFDGRMK